MPCDYYQLPHPGIRSLHPYIPGKSIDELIKEQGLADIIKLASNENPLGCSPLVQEALAKLGALQIAAYPAPAHHPLLAKLSQKLAIDQEMLTLSDGTDLLFFFLLTAFALNNGKHILTHQHAFLSYEVQAQTLGIPVVITPLYSDWQINIHEIIAQCNLQTGLIFIANPNNPTGLFTPLAEIKRLLTAIPESTILVLDEAYYEYAYDFGDHTSLDLLLQYPNLVITRTFSKAYGLAGLRIGYAIAHPEITQLLQRVQLPFAVNQAALAAANAALDDEDFLRQSIMLNYQGMQQICQALDELKIGYLPSRCNFITMDCKTDSRPLYEQLLQAGIIVRPLHQYKLAHFLRISIGNSLQNNRFLDTLATEHK